MVYLDYSATCPVDDKVLDSFIKATKYSANPNSLHKLGVEAKELIDASSKQISDILNVKPSEIIYTSGASEANNLAIKGIEAYKNRGNHIITTEIEHSSIYGPISYLTDNGFDVDFVPVEGGIVDIKKLEAMITDKTILVSIGYVNSETGIEEPINEIGEMLKKYPKVIFHTDMTQAVGKIKVNLNNVHLASFAAHKFFGLKGIGILVKKENINLIPLIHGGKSTTIYRSGTPATQLIVSTAKALRLSIQNMEEDILRITKLNEKIKNSLKDLDGVYINSNEYSIPHILNISTIGVKPETMLHALEMDDIYVSTQSACSTGETSKAVMAITNDKDKAASSIRVSISRKTTEEEIDNFIESFIKNHKSLRLQNENN